MSVPPPPPLAELADFPALSWHATLHRITRIRNPDGSERLPLFFSTSGDGRFDLAERASRSGTCYLGTSEIACVVEVFGRVRAIPTSALQDYQLVTLSAGERLRLADLCAPPVLGRFGLTREVCTTEDYGRTQDWARAFFGAGFAGIHYAPRHDPRGDLRAIALFGPAGTPPPLEARLHLEHIGPLSDSCLRLAARYGLYAAEPPPRDPVAKQPG